MGDLERISLLQQGSALTTALPHQGHFVHRCSTFCLYFLTLDFSKWMYVRRFRKWWVWSCSIYSSDRVCVSACCEQLLWKPRCQTQIQHQLKVGLGCFKMLPINSKFWVPLSDIHTVWLATGHPLLTQPLSLHDLKAFLPPSPKQFLLKEKYFVAPIVQIARMPWPYTEQSLPFPFWTLAIFLSFIKKQ